MYKDILKRVLDIVISVIALPFLIIITVVVAPLIYLTDKGSVFYCADRLGKDGKRFKMYKFRSMYERAPDIRNSDGTTYNADNDPRVTPIGRFMRKTSLDETAQIINVLLGDMSFIGPRPDLPPTIPFTDVKEIYNRTYMKFTVKPGITGYSQAYYRNDIDYAERNMKDVWYAENVNLGLDIRIFIKTIATVLTHHGLNRGDRNTVSAEEVTRIVSEYNQTKG